MSVVGGEEPRALGEQRRVLETETPTVLAPWDPFGALA